MPAMGLAARCAGLAAPAWRAPASPGPCGKAARKEGRGLPEPAASPPLVFSRPQGTGPPPPA